MQGYAQPPQQQYIPQQPQYGAPPPQQQQQQPYYDGASQAGPPPQQQPQYGGPPPQQQPYQGPPGPAQYNSYAAPGAAPPGPAPQGGPPIGPPGQAVGMKRPLDDGYAAAGAPQQKRQDVQQTTEPRGPPETVLRLLVPMRRVGSIIGKHGAVVKEIKEKTGARIRIVEPVPGSEERVVIISAPDDPSVDRNDAELALFEVHRRAIDGEEPIPAQGRDPSGILTRMLVCHTQAGSIIGKGGVQIKAIRDVSGSFIKILPPDELPPVALSNDRVVQIVGQPDALARALGEVSKLIRANPPKERPGGPSPALAAIAGIPAGPPASHVMQQRMQGAVGGFPGGGGGPPGGGVITKNVLVPDGQVGSIIGSQGATINRIRQESGARVKVHDPNPNNPTQRTIECTGTAAQIAAAERLIEPYAREGGPYGQQAAY